MDKLWSIYIIEYYSIMKLSNLSVVKLSGGFILLQIAGPIQEPDSVSLGWNPVIAFKQILR